MLYPAIAKLVLEKGLDNVSVPVNIRGQAMTEAGQLLFKEGRYEESGKAYARAMNYPALNEAADYLTKQSRFKQASYFLIHTGDKEKMEACALKCIELGHQHEAIKLFETTGNQEMLAFVKANF